MKILLISKDNWLSLHDTATMTTPLINPNGDNKKQIYFDNVL